MHIFERHNDQVREAKLKQNITVYNLCFESSSLNRVDKDKLPFTEVIFFCISFYIL